MRIVIAPDSFKGTLTASEAAAAMERGVREVWPDADIRLLPLADGGEGSLEILYHAAGGQFHSVAVRGPLGDPVEAPVLELPDGAAVVEMAQASGLLLVPPERRNAETASTFGTGQLIRAALQRGASCVIVCLGGSATTDGGAGMAEALGFRLLDASGNPLPPGGSALVHLSRIDTSGADRRIGSVRFIAATDVTNPLCGDRGAAAVYGPQKGASPEAVQRLDAGLARLAEALKESFGAEVRDLPGSGAAGGLGAGLAGFLNARIESGAETLMDAARVDTALSDADLCLTGEGHIDSQSAQGKLLSRLAARCLRADVPLVAIGGGVAPGATVAGVRAILSATVEPGPPPASGDEAAGRITAAAGTACRLIELGADMAGEK